MKKLAVLVVALLFVCLAVAVFAQEGQEIAAKTSLSPNVRPAVTIDTGDTAWVLFATALVMLVEEQRLQSTPLTGQR